jgi:hypothetical protein
MNRGRWQAADAGGKPLADASKKVRPSVSTKTATTNCLHNSRKQTSKRMSGNHD